ncbi:hypothetical protein QRX50_36515 [Amycolatopsis carbonis]|uniref:Uncharacterized protein n=1 Tax=Amycolatopsis carbonis TaxID=715471 RepID=A0A9Y2IBJ8_9PSEU|nr:hypothetical protein [Amycolatopsis sp. 2-15]WIX76889.1 hypothetical protein QRX50_36515 [Amycolatopsis sp. 2-15]
MAIPGSRHGAELALLRAWSREIDAEPYAEGLQLERLKARWSECPALLALPTLADEQSPPARQATQGVAFSTDHGSSRLLMKNSARSSGAGTPRVECEPAASSAPAEEAGMATLGSRGNRAR